MRWLLMLTTPPVDSRVHVLEAGAQVSGDGR
jgi:hypothetical protein